MSLVSDFHADNFPGYDNIPKSWSGIGDATKVARDSLGNANIPKYAAASVERKAIQDSFERVVTSSAESVQSAAKKGFFAKAKDALKNLGKLASKHKVATAIIGATTAALGLAAIVKHDKEMHKRKKV